MEFLSGNAAVIVSVCALVLTTTQIALTRRHNRLSVQPHLTTHTTQRIDQETGLATLQSTLSNCGLGPAFVKKFEVLLDGEAFSVTEPHDLLELAVKIWPERIVEEQCFFGILRRDGVLAKDGLLEVAKVVLHNATGDQLAAARRFHLRITYASAYGETFTYDSRKHLE
jgi:hypothetical protein